MARLLQHDAGRGRPRRRGARRRPRGPRRDRGQARAQPRPADRRRAPRAAARSRARICASLVQETVTIGRTVLGARASAPRSPRRPTAAGIGPERPAAATALARPDRPARCAARRAARRRRRRRELAPDELAFLQATANVLADAIERRRAEERARHQALHDPLTGLPNRDAVPRPPRRTALAPASAAGSSVAVLFLDLDHFKLINDSLGHQAGDELLRRVAPRLSEALRPGDTVARFGGDEFASLRRHRRRRRRRSASPSASTAALGAPVHARRRRARSSRASIGVALASGRRRTAEDLVRDADAAMYRAKERGAAGSSSSTTPCAPAPSRGCELENDLRRAIDRRRAARSTTSRSSRCDRARSSGSRRWCAGTTPSAGSSRRASSSRRRGERR